jgi:glycosidase
VVDDHFGINPEVGTAGELRAFVDRAHDLDLRVMFDFIPQGVGDSSPFLEQHPDWLVRDALGRTFGSHGWGPRAGAPNNGHTLSLDWGNPEVCQFAVDWAMWYVSTFDIDGFRCDAMHWKEPNLALDNPRPAWQTIYGGVRILEDLRQRLKAVKPDAVLLSEVWGPIFQPRTDGSYENGHITNQLNRGWLGMSDKPLMTAAQYCDYLVYAEAARPEGYLRANFSANHDMQAIAREARQNPLGDAISLVHAFAKGIPFVTWLEIEGREAFFATLMRHRAALNGYTCSYTAAETDSEDLFLALWHKAGQASVLAVSNLSLNRTRARVRLSEQSHAPQVILGEGTSVQRGPDGIQVDLPGAGYALIRLE